jgi:putative ABC transport system permease protein
MKYNRIQLPKIATILLFCLHPRYDFEHVIGAYEQGYNQILESKGKLVALLWISSQIFRSSPVLLKLKIFGGLAMLKNYLKIAVRNILKHKGFSTINISGLAVGMTCAILIFLWVKHETSYDRFHKHAKDIYQIYKYNEQSTQYGYQLPGPLAPALESQYPEIIRATRFWSSGYNNPLRYQDEVFSGSACGVEDTFFDIFTFPFISGNPKEALSQPDFIILTEKIAEKYFSNENPIGKVMTFEWWGKWYEFHVTGVIKDVPPNSSIKFDFLLPFSFVKKSGWNLDSWSSSAVEAYVLVQRGIPIERIQQKIARLIQAHVPESAAKLHLFPLTHNHLYNLRGSGRITYVYIFSSIGILILLVACINFMNLSTSRSLNRSKEIGLRKVIGSSRKQLIIQFLGESFLMTFIALFIAVFLIHSLLPTTNNLLGSPIKLVYSRTLIVGLIAIALFTGLFSGSYPALFLSRVSPFQVLKGSGKSGLRNPLFRKVFVVTQFIISILLVICAVIAARQLDFIKAKDLGFNKEQIINLKLRGSFYNQYSIIKQALLQNPNIIKIGLTNAGFSNNSNSTGAVTWEGKDKGKRIAFNIHSVDYDYMDIFDIRLAQGRFFSKDFSTDDREAFVINEAAVNAMGITQPLGKTFTWTFVNRSFKGKIIGVVKDFNFQSLHDEIKPMFMVIAPWWYNRVYIKIKPENIPGSLGFLEKTLNRIVPDYPFEYSFLDEDINKLYKTEQQASTLFEHGTFLAIFIACLGLLGLVSYTAEQRTKEISIRKVLGASVSGIVLLLSKEFSKWILLANIIAWPIAFLIMRSWLQQFAYRINIDIWIFILSGVLAMLVALLTISYQSIKTACSNPVDTLRHE